MGPRILFVLASAAASCVIKPGGLAPTGSSPPASSEDRVVATGPSKAVAMPELGGLTEADARAALARAGIDGEIEVDPDIACPDSESPAKGRVCYQSPLAGATTLSHAPVTLQYQQADASSTTPGVAGAHYAMPDVTKLTVAQAREKLRAAGFSAADHFLLDMDPACQPKGVICWTEPAPGEPTTTELHKILTVGEANDPGPDEDWSGDLFDRH
jgi:beta-lactam-binding protein with PASTA domain